MARIPKFGPSAGSFQLIEDPMNTSPDALTLKACPFCGGEVRWCGADPDPAEVHDCDQITCPTCGNFVSKVGHGAEDFPSVQAAVAEVWNRRAELESALATVPVGGVDALIAAATEACDHWDSNCEQQIPPQIGMATYLRGVRAALSEVQRATPPEKALAGGVENDKAEIRLSVYWSSHYNLWRCESLLIQAWGETPAACLADWIAKKYPPAPAGTPAVDEAMVERACMSYVGLDAWHDLDAAEQADSLRRMTAAIKGPAP